MKCFEKTQKLISSVCSYETLIQHGFEDLETIALTSPNVFKKIGVRNSDELVQLASIHCWCYLSPRKREKKKMLLKLPKNKPVSKKFNDTSFLC